MYQSKSLDLVHSVQIHSEQWSDMDHGRYPMYQQLRFKVPSAQISLITISHCPRRCRFDMMTMNTSHIHWDCSHLTAHQIVGDASNSFCNFLTLTSRQTWPLHSVIGQVWAGFGFHTTTLSFHVYNWVQLCDCFQAKNAQSRLCSPCESWASPLSVTTSCSPYVWVQLFRTTLNTFHNSFLAFSHFLVSVKDPAHEIGGGILDSVTNGSEGAQLLPPLTGRSEVLLKSSILELDQIIVVTKDTSGRKTLLTFEVGKYFYNWTTISAIAFIYW